MIEQSFERQVCCYRRESVPNTQPVFDFCDVPKMYSRNTEDCIGLSTFRVASLRRQTQPLRGYIRRRLARGACRPPSIPPFERVHAFAWERSVP